jgi:WD repeat-containing protein 68
MQPLLRVTWNKHDPNYLATLCTDSGKVVILDIRAPSVAVCELNGHKAAANAVCWAPQTETHIATCADDCGALIWDVSVRPAGHYTIDDPVLAYTASAEINNMLWCRSHEDWIVISYAKQVQILKV